MKKVCLISDTHNFQFQNPPRGIDILIHAGDATGLGSVPEVLQLSDWFKRLPFKHIIFCPGNHDFLFQSMESTARSIMPSNVTILIDQEITIDGIRIYGSPWQPEFCNWAFNYYPEEAEAIWAKIPGEQSLPSSGESRRLDILVTHGPPRGIHDLTENGIFIGCSVLARRVQETKPRFHVFGHNHADGGKQVAIDGTLYINAAAKYEDYSNRPEPWMVIDV